MENLPSKTCVLAESISPASAETCAEMSGENLFDFRIYESSLDSEGKPSAVITPKVGRQMKFDLSTT